MKKLLVLFVAVFCVFLAASCVPSNADKAKAKLEKAGYDVEVFTGEDASEEFDGCIAIVEAEHEEKEIFVFAYLFSSKDKAKAFYDEIKDSEEEHAELSGKWVIGGDEEGIKAFKK